MADANQTPSAIQVNIAARRRQALMARIVVVKVVLARLVARTKIAEPETNVVLLTSVSIVAVQVVLQIQTVTKDSTVVRKFIRINLVSAVLIVLENFVIQVTIVADLPRLVTTIDVKKSKFSQLGQ